MGMPLILYGLQEIANWSFESDDDGDPPGSWDTAQSISGVSLVSDSVYHSAGAGIPSARSLRQNVLDPTTGNVAVAAQRFDLGELATIARDLEVEVAAVALLKPESQVGLDNAVIRLMQRDGTSVTPGDGALQVAPSEAMAIVGGPDWYLAIARAELAAGTTRVDLELTYQVDRGGFDGAGSVWWDRVFLGGLVDLPRRFAEGITARFEHGIVANEGDGEVELVRVAGPRTEISVEVRNLGNSHAGALQLRALQRWLGSSTGFLALWRDRELSTNDQEHFQRLVVDRRFGYRLPGGPLRRSFELDLVAPSEGLG